MGGGVKVSLVYFLENLSLEECFFLKDRCIVMNCRVSRRQDTLTEVDEARQGDAGD
jgi:hypothetical protein